MSGNQFKIKPLLIKITIALILVGILSAYSAGVLNTLITGYGPSYLPSAVIDCIKIYGFPTVPFIILYAMFVIMAAMVIMKAYQDTKGMDVMGRLFKLSVNRKGYGDSHFETPEEYKKIAVIQSPEDAYGTILGQLDTSGKRLINFRMDEENRLNSHMIAVGASGSGKTYTFTKNYIFQAAKRRESIILTDPDGGLYRDMAGYLQDNGYIIRRFDLSNLMKSDGWHCLKSVYSDDVTEMALNAQIFAKTVISNVSGNKQEGIYVDGPLSLLKALILRVMLGHDYPPEAKTIKSVYELLQNPAGEAYLDMMFDPTQLEMDEKPCHGPYMVFKQGSPNLRGNIITNLATQLQLFQSEMVCKVMSTDDIDLTLPGLQPCAYFCVFPDSHDTYKFIVSLFFSMLFITLISLADKQPDGKLPVPVDFLLDEFPSIGILPDWDKKMATVRKRSINVVMIFQDITQLQNNYDKTWVTLLNNCATIVSLGINDEVTAKWLSTRIGETTIEVQTRQHDAYESPFKIFHKHSSGEGRRALLTVDEILRINENDCIIHCQGHYPILAKKYPHVNHPEAQKLRKIYPEDIPDITDEAARAEQRAKEKSFVDRYLAEHPLSEVDRTYNGKCESTQQKSKSNSASKGSSEAAADTEEGILDNSALVFAENLILVDSNDKLKQGIQPDKSNTSTMCSEAVDTKPCKPIVIETPGTEEDFFYGELYDGPPSLDDEDKLVQPADEADNINEEVTGKQTRRAGMNTMPEPFSKRHKFSTTETITLPPPKKTTGA